jgi:hypothetical protein
MHEKRDLNRMLLDYEYDGLNRLTRETLNSSDNALDYRDDYVFDLTSNRLQKKHDVQIKGVRTRCSVGTEVAQEFVAMSDFLRWVTATHTMRDHAQYQTSGEGLVYQGRFKSFPIQDDEHFLTDCRYVERNARRAGLTNRAEARRWIVVSMASAV